MFVIIDRICKNSFSFKANVLALRGIWHIHMLGVEKTQAKVMVQHISTSLALREILFFL